MNEFENTKDNPLYLKVEPKRPIVVRAVTERPLKKKIENSDNKFMSDVVAGVRIGTSFSGNDFGSVDFSGLELYKAMFPKAKLEGSSFANSDLSGSNFEKANLANVDFSGAVLKNVNFKGADLTGADFSNANLEGADLSEAIIKDALVCNTNLAGVKLTKTVREELQRIREAMQEIDLTKVDLRKIDLRYVDFKNVDLRGVDFTGVDLSGVNLVGVNLSGAKIDFSKIDGTHFLKSAANNKIKISKGNLAGLDPLTVHQIQTQMKEEKEKKEQIKVEEKQKEEIVLKNTKRPPYKVREEDYVKSKYDFPDLHTKIIEREEKAREEQEKQKEQSIQKNEENKDTDTKKPRKFFPTRIRNKRDGKIKVRN